MKKGEKMSEVEARREKLTEYIKDNEDKLYRLAFHYVKQEEEALDLLQDAIVKALTNLSKLKNTEFLQTWFYRILINECLMAIRKNKNKIPSFSLEDYDIPCNDKEILSCIDLYQAIDKLKPKLRTVVVLRFFEDKSLEEISLITKTNLSTIKSRLYKALEELKNQMGKDVIL